ncbi:hypothetical protein EAI_07822 [Harpegnathos saltator]|uniref:Uncharacterized protein n=1 Tax=Harpegnathos saltator TaxID=610380 RepID=E2BLH4_HARSA|nr:hypothetical protein EAI_07822 [Harpegnathos saltator]
MGYKEGQVVSSAEHKILASKEDNPLQRKTSGNPTSEVRLAVNSVKSLLMVEYNFKKLDCKQFYDYCVESKKLPMFGAAQNMNRVEMLQQTNKKHI